MNKIATTISTIAAVLLAGACSKAVVEQEGSAVTLDYIVSVTEAATKSLGDGSTVDKLAYAIYETESDDVYASGIVDEAEGKFSFAPSIFFGKDYDIVLFAYTEGAYDVSDLQEVKANTVGEVADAFCLKETVRIAKDETVFVNGVSTDKSYRAGRDVTLSRPFAQLNIGTESLDDLYEVGAAKIKVTISNYNADSYNVRSGSVNPVDDTALEYEFDIKDISNNTFTVEEIAYNYVSLNYLLPVGTVNATVTVLKEVGTIVRTIPTFSSLPLVANKKTNIYGNLVKGELTFNVSVNKEFNTEDNDNNIE